MTTPEWLIATILILSFFQWMGNMRWLWANYLDPAIIHINDPACHPPPSTLSPAHERYIERYAHQFTQAAANGQPLPTWEPQRAGIPNA